MLPSLTVCVLFLFASSVAGNGPKVPPQMFPSQNIYPEARGDFFPMMQPEFQGRYQNYAPFPRMPRMWENTHMQPMPFFHPPGCDIPFHQHMDMIGSPFINQGQWTGTPFQGQGQWQHTAFPIQGQAQWKQTVFPNQGKGQMKRPPFPNQGKGQIKQLPFLNQGKRQMKKPTFPNQGQGQWKQPTSWNMNQNVRMVEQWDAFPVNQQMLSQPAVSGLAPKEADFQPGTFNPPKIGSQTFGFNGLDEPVPVQRD
ncbi:uncharacterized protein LOC123549040 [Mercenaria mercenaria]|uniref:uncharacterized protein LOC123549040 n=1 Tax=Mercenaria mercenaria TaxID=6596 RepID=UPI00234EC71F|nr:uncharacterized protein LOC123549040 [Mercenaria mercenaria]